MLVDVQYWSQMTQHGGMGVQTLQIVIFIAHCAAKDTNMSGTREREQLAHHHKEGCHEGHSVCKIPPRKR
jgi:hypothetical protein